MYETGLQCFLQSLGIWHKNVNRWRKSLWRSKYKLNDALKYQLRGCRPNIIVIFHLKNIFLLYTEMPSHLNSAHKANFYFQFIEQKLGPGCTLILPPLLLTTEAASTCASCICCRPCRPASQPGPPRLLCLLAGFGTEASHRQQDPHCPPAQFSFSTAARPRVLRRLLLSGLAAVLTTSLSFCA